MKIICKLVEILKINNCILVCINLWCHDCLVCRHIHDTCRTQQISDYKYDKIFYRVISDYKYDFFIFEQAMLTTRSSVILVVSRRGGHKIWPDNSLRCLWERRKIRWGAFDFWWHVERVQKKRLGRGENWRGQGGGGGGEGGHRPPTWKSSTILDFRLFVQTELSDQQEGDLTRLTDFNWHSQSRSQSVFPVHQWTD